MCVSVLSYVKLELVYLDNPIKLGRRYSLFVCEIVWRPDDEWWVRVSVIKNYRGRFLRSRQSFSKVKFREDVKAYHYVTESYIVTPSQICHMCDIWWWLPGSVKWMEPLWNVKVSVSLDDDDMLILRSIFYHAKKEDKSSIFWRLRFDVQFWIRTVWCFKTLQETNPHIFCNEMAPI